jgi:hypothetical protein
MVGPFFAVARFQGTFDQSDKSIILDVFSEDVDQNGVIDIIETPFDIPFNKPLRPWPEFVNFVKGRVASPARSEAV